MGDGGGPGFEEIFVKTRNRYYDMRAVLAHLSLQRQQTGPYPTDTKESKVYFSELLPAEVARSNRSDAALVQVE